MTDKEKIAIYNEFLIQFHTCAWTGHTEGLKKCFKVMGDYSYCRTNSNAGDEYPKKCEERTLLALKNV